MARKRFSIFRLLNTSKLECHKCGKVGGYPAMIRWHYKRKCKGKKVAHVAA